MSKRVKQKLVLSNSNTNLDFSKHIGQVYNAQAFVVMASTNSSSNCCLQFSGNTCLANQAFSAASFLPVPTVSHGLPFLAPFQPLIIGTSASCRGAGLKAWPRASDRASSMQSMWNHSEHLVQYCWESSGGLYIFWHVHVKLMPCQTRLSQVAGLKDGEYIPWTKAPRWVWTHTLVDNTTQLGEATLPWHPCHQILWYGSGLKGLVKK